MNLSKVAYCDSIYPTIAVSNLLETVNYYRDQLGFEVQFLWGEPPVHGGVVFGNATVHFNEHAQSQFQSENGFWLYFQVDDVDALYDQYQSRDVECLDSPTDREWGMREINIRDINGMTIRFGQPNLKFGAPVPVKRSEISARIESRLANLLKDLAKHKNMSFGEMLEELALHSFEPAPKSAGHAAASPHTTRTLEYVQQLKQKHDIDYDVHDAYRFSEKD